MIFINQGKLFYTPPNDNRMEIGLLSCDMNMHNKDVFNDRTN